MDANERELNSGSVLPNDIEQNERKFICSPSVLSLRAYVLLGCILAGGGVNILLLQSRKITPIFDLLFEDLFCWAMLFGGLGILFFVARKMRTPAPRVRSIVLNANELLAHHYSICSNVIRVPYESITEIRKHRYFDGWRVIVKHSYGLLFIQLADLPQKDAADMIFSELCSRAPATTQKISLNAWQFTLRGLFGITTALAVWLGLIAMTKPLPKCLSLAMIAGIVVCGIFKERWFITLQSRTWQAFFMGFCLGVFIEGLGTMFWCLVPDWATLPYPFSIRLFTRIYTDPTAGVDFGVLLVPTVISVFLLSGGLFGLIGVIVYRWRLHRADKK